MQPYLLLCVEVLVTITISLASGDNNTISSSCYTITVGASVSLQGAVEQILSQGSRDDATDCTRVVVPSGVHTIVSQTLFQVQPARVQFVGEGPGVYVACSYSAVSDYDYTWYFDQLESVYLDNINFEGCPRPLRLDTIAEVEITNCSFRFFSEAVLDIYNCHHTLFTGTTLEHNRGSGIAQYSFRGNTGGVCFGYNGLPSHFSSPSLLVANSSFLNNSATADSIFLTSNQAFTKQVYTGRGGAMAVFCNESQISLNVVITDSIFEKNYARSFGGGIYLLPGGVTSHKMRVQRSRFDSNSAGIGAGGVVVTYINNGPKDDPILVTIVDSNITNNWAPFNGGGMYVTSNTDSDGNRLQIRGSVMSGNRAYFGGAVVLESVRIYHETTSLPHHEITNCTFRDNSGTSGVVGVWFVITTFSDNNWFIQNSGNALQVISSLVYLSGELHFVENSGGDDSALHMLSFAQAVLMKGVVISFEGNTGRFGASMFIESQYSIPQAYNQSGQCFLRYETNILPEDWTEVTVQFNQNRAILGSAIYMSRLDMHACSSAFSFMVPYLRDNDDYAIVDWPVWNFGETNVNTGYFRNQSSPYLSVQTKAKELVVFNSTIKAWPGFKLRIGIEGVDEFSNPTTTTARFYFQPLNETQDIEVRFSPEVVVIGTDPRTGLLIREFTITYSIGSKSNPLLSVNHEGPLGVVSVQVPFKTSLDVQPARFTLEAVACPGGYVLRPTTVQTSLRVCTCNQDISEVVHCEDDQENVVIERGKWAVYVPSQESANLEFYACPPGYCRCRQDSSIGNSTCVYTYTHSDPDLQCSCGRRGVLCGQCRNESAGYSALLNDCVSCNDASGLLILALIIVDAAVFVLILLLDRPLPSWAYPFIFYIQVAPIAGLYFPDSFNRVGKYLYFVGSASSFYFPYDFCLYGTMSSEMAYFLRFTPLIVAVLTTISVLSIRSCTKKLKMRIKSLKMHGVWWLVVLIYTHVVYASMTILNCPLISDTHGTTTSPHWFVNGEVHCFTGSHILLAILALVVLVAAVLVLPLCILLFLKPHWKILKALECLQEPLRKSYRENCQWWSAVELGRRFLFILFIVALPRNGVIPVLVLAVYTTVYGYAQPYKARVVNLIETAVNLNFLVLTMLNSTSFFSEDFFVFSSDSTSSPQEEEDCVDGVSGVAVVSWILMPIYYLPLAAFGVTAVIFIVLYLRTVFLKRSKKRAVNTQELLEESYSCISSNLSSNYQQWSIGLNDDGFVLVENEFEHTASPSYDSQSTST